MECEIYIIVCVQEDTERVGREARLGEAGKKDEEEEEERLKAEEVMSSTSLVSVSELFQSALDVFSYVP